MRAWAYRRAVVLLLMAAPLAGCRGEPGDAAPPPLASSPAPEALRSVAAWIVESQAAPGAIVGVRPRGGGITLAAAGVADLTSGRAMAPEAPYYLGSITKVYVATVVLQLVEEGRIGLEQPLSGFLPGFPGAEAIRVRHLLQHSSGLADVAVWAYFRPDWTEMVRQVTREWTRRELVAKAAELEPDFPPGSFHRFLRQSRFRRRPVHHGPPGGDPGVLRGRPAGSRARRWGSSPAARQSCGASPAARSSTAAASSERPVARRRRA